MSDGYNAYVFIGDELKSTRFKDTVRQVCMSHAKNKFVKAFNQGGEPAAERFSNILREFFMRERKCGDAGFSPGRAATGNAKPGNESAPDRIAKPVRE